MDSSPASPVKVTQEERIMAALSHASIILPMSGLIVPVLIWVTQKSKSTYVSFQSVQAIAFHIVQILVGFLGGFCYMCSIFGSFFPMALFSSEQGSNAPPVFMMPFFLPLGIIVIVLVGYFALILYGIAGAVLTLQGKDFRYIILGDRVQRFLEQP